MDYETLDTIADSYIPLLATIFFTAWARKIFISETEGPHLKSVLLYFAILLCTSYALMFIDNMVGIWPSFGLDYSTHTAVSLSIALSLCVLVLKARTIMACTFLMYMLLMLYQEYHTALDIVTTMAPMLFVAAISHRLLFGTARNRNPSLPEC